MASPQSILENDMGSTNAIGWFDIYVDDMDRAVAFYESVFKQKMEKIGDHARPGIGGTMVYFSVEDCSVEESRVVAAKGKIVRPKFSIGEFGWVTLCVDTEGNMFGLNSMN
jgi:uncharacterized protein